MKENFNFNVKKKRPEEIYQNIFDYFTEETIFQYATSKNMRKIQEKITLRVLEILDLKNKNILILDAGSGPGFATDLLKSLGFQKIIALDLIPRFLKFFELSDRNPVLADMCFLPFRSHIFDAIISISALQWIYRDINNKKMNLRLTNMVKAFYHVLKSKSNLVIQFYPKSKKIMDNIRKIIVNSTDFDGKFIIDNPNNPKKRKIFLLLKKN